MNEIILNQICTLEQAKTLAELGVLQIGGNFFAYIKNRCRDETEFSPTIVQYPGCDNKGYEDPSTGCLEGYAAFTLHELGRMIGKGTVAADRFHGYLLRRLNSSHSITVCYDTIDVTAFVITLVKDGYLRVEEINKRLIG